MENSKSILNASINTCVDRVYADKNNSLLTDLGIKTRKESNAAYHLVPFLLKVLDIEKSEMTDAISKSIVDLDDLAQQIDSVIDTKDNCISQKNNYTDFDNLELNIIECFSHMTGSAQLEKLILDTLKCVNKSFKYNTVERPRIYKLKTTEFEGCTTYYLFPLVEYLFSHSKFQTKNQHLFFLVANYIQILDDYLDVFEDTDLQIKTPITIRFKEIVENNITNPKTQSCFQLLTDEVFVTLIKYLSEIQTEAKQINEHLPVGLFNEWEKFHEDFQNIKFPNKSTEKKLKEYQKEILRRVPQIVCYT